MVNQLVLCNLSRMAVSRAVIMLKTGSWKIINKM